MISGPDRPVSGPPGPRPAAKEYADPCGWESLLPVIEAKEMLMNKLKAAGVNLSKVKIVAINSVVQGPKYKGDFKDTEKYSKFQYIKLKAF